MKRVWLVASAIVIFLVLLTSAFLLVKKNTRGKADPFNSPGLSEALSKGDYLQLKKIYKEALETETAADKLKEIQQKIEEINIKLLFSPISTACSTQYTVKPGDTLMKIAKEFKTSLGLIKRANSLSSDTIRPGEKLKINTCKFSIIVDKSQNLLFLKTGDEMLKTYTVSTGKDNSTPVGNFTIVNKIANPTWFKTGAVIPPESSENILGSRWMGFNLKGYGIHGTTEPDNLGKQVTMGCVRMRNDEVEELYDIVSEGTEVTIVD